MGLTSDSKTKVVIFGMDGATWKLLDRLVADGTMPNLGALRQHSRYGNLISTTPPDTPTGWASIARGINPGGTGFFGFHRPGASIDEFKPITSFVAQGTSFPEILERHGAKVVLINFPTMSASPIVQGPVLGDILSPAKRMVSPPSLADRAPFKEYRVFPSVSPLPDLDRYIEDIRKLEATRFACAQDLFESEWNLFFVMFSASDWIQHELFSELLDGHGKHVREAKLVYHDLDDYLGWFVHGLASGGTILVISDHGFESRVGTLSVNLWLANHGYLAQKFASGQVSLKAGSTRLPLPAGVMNALSRSRRLWSLSARLARFSLGHTLNVDSFNVPPDPDNTLAYYVEFDWGIYMNSKRRFERGIIESNREDAVRQKIIADLHELVDSGLLRDVKLGKEVYRGAQADMGPDIVIYPSEYTFCGLSSHIVFRFPKVGRNMLRNAHSLDGIYLVSEPRAESAESKERRIVDIFPTVLELFGVPIPLEAEGASIISNAPSRAVAPSDQPSTRKPTPVVSDEDEGEILERLKRLGYV